MMMMLTAMRKDRIGWRDKSSLGPRGAKRPPLLSSQMAAQNQMAPVAMMRTLMLLMNMIKECILLFWESGRKWLTRGVSLMWKWVIWNFLSRSMWNFEIGQSDPSPSEFSSSSSWFYRLFPQQKIYQVVFNRHKQGNLPQTNLSIIIILNKIVILILFMDDLEFSLVEIGKSDPSLGASKNQLHHVGGQFSLHILQYQHHHIGRQFFCMFSNIDIISYSSSLSSINDHIVAIAIPKILQLSCQYKALKDLGIFRRLIWLKHWLIIPFEMYLVMVSLQNRSG